MLKHNLQGCTPRVQSCCSQSPSSTRMAQVSARVEGPTGSTVSMRADIMRWLHVGILLTAGMLAALVGC